MIWPTGGSISSARATAYKALDPLIGGTIDVRVIAENWDEILRLAASIKAGTVAPSAILRRLAAYPRQNALAKALKEIGRLERTLFMLDWISDPALRRRTNAGLNKGEARNALARAVFFHRLGEIRDRTFENQRYRASGLNLAVAAIILWNTVYLGRAVDELRSRGEIIPDELLAHVAPLGWEHIAFNGDYVWPAEPSETPSGPYEIPAPSSSTRLSVGFGTDSTMTPTCAVRLASTGPPISRAPTSSTRSRRGSPIFLPVCRRCARSLRAKTSRLPNPAVSAAPHTNARTGTAAQATSRPTGFSGLPRLSEDGAGRLQGDGDRGGVGDSRRLSAHRQAGRHARGDRERKALGRRRS